MSNAAYTDKYKQRWNECQPLFISDNCTQKEEQQLSDEYTLEVTGYAGKVNKCNLCGSECRLFDKSKKIVAQWRSIDNSAEFYKIIEHSDGKEYLIFRQDLYGYSVLDIKSGKLKQFFPEYSLCGGETFIWTSIAYNTESNILAVSGCYWACPDSTHLFKFDNPMNDTPEYIDLIECFDGEYDMYDDVYFVKWDSGDLHVTRYAIETKTNEPVVITQDEYLLWLSQKGQAL